MSAKQRHCERYRQEMLLAEEQGAGLPAELSAHISGCAECRQDRSQFQALRAAIGALPAPVPPAGWEQRVWAGTAGRRPRSHRAWMRWLWVGLALPAAAVLLLLLRPRPPAGQVEGAFVLAMSFEKDPDAPARRGDIVAGDLLVLTVDGIQQPAAEVRVYRDDAGLRLRCSETPPCTRRGSGLSLRWPVPSVGRYRVVVVSSSKPLPPPGGSFDGDIAALVTGGARWRTSEFEVW